MSMRLRMPFALLAALVMVLFSSGPAFAEDGTEETADPTVAAILEDLTGTTASGAANTSDSARSSTADESQSTSATATRSTAPPPAARVAGLGDGNAALSDAAATPPTTSPSTSETPPECIARVVQQLITDLQEALGANGDELAAMIEEALDPANAANLPAFLATLPDLLAEQGEDLSTEGELLLSKAGQELQKCLPAPPAGGGSQTSTPRPSQASGQYTPPTTQPSAFTYRNCDEARALGKAPVYAGQPGYGTHLDSDYDGIGCEETAETVVAQPVAYAGTGKLAYTGVTVQPMVAWGAALVLSGGWLIASGRRRA